MRNTIILPPNSDTVLIKVKKKYTNTTIQWRNSKYGRELVEMQNDVPPPVTNADGSTTHHLIAYRPIPEPYTIGQVVSVRETWCALCEQWIYKSTFGSKITEGYTWRSPATMPLSACRRKVVIASQDLTEKDGVFYWEIGTKPADKPDL